MCEPDGTNVTGNKGPNMTTPKRASFIWIYSAVLSFVLGIGATAGSNFLSMSTRVSVLESKQEDVKDQLTGIEKKIDRLGDKIDLIKR
jgi:hypothetical protein